MRTPIFVPGLELDDDDPVIRLKAPHALGASHATEVLKNANVDPGAPG